MSLLDTGWQSFTLVLVLMLVHGEKLFECGYKDPPCEDDNND